MAPAATVVAQGAARQSGVYRHRLDQRANNCGQQPADRPIAWCTEPPPAHVASLPGRPQIHTYALDYVWHSGSQVHR